MIVVIGEKTTYKANKKKLSHCIILRIIFFFFFLIQTCPQQCFFFFFYSGFRNINCLQTNQIKINLWINNHQHPFQWHMTMDIEMENKNIFWSSINIILQLYMMMIIISLRFHWNSVTDQQSIVKVNYIQVF